MPAKPALTKIIKARVTTTQHTDVVLKEEEVAEILRKHFELSASATVEFACSGGYLAEVVLNDVVLLKDEEITRDA